MSTLEPSPREPIQRVTANPTRRPSLVEMNGIPIRRAARNTKDAARWAGYGLGSWVGPADLLEQWADVVGNAPSSHLLNPPNIDSWACLPPARAQCTHVGEERVRSCWRRQEMRSDGLTPRL